MAREAELLQQILTKLKETSKKNFLIDEDPLRIDEVSSNLTYIGIARVGTEDSERKWKIKRITVTGTVTSITYPNGSKDFEFVWDDRATYTYS